MKYEAILSVMGKTYTAVGDTALEAINSLEVKNAKGRGVLTIKHGTIQRDRVLASTVVSRLFNSIGLMKQVALKNMSVLFSGL